MLLALTPDDAVGAVSPAFTAPGASSVSREWVVLRADRTAHGAALEPLGEWSDRATRAGLVVAASLGSPGGRTGRSVHAPPSRGPAPRPNPFDLDPSRVLLLRAGPDTNPDAARDFLRDDPGVEWAEPNLSREACDFPLDGSLPADPLLRDTRQWGLWNAGATGAYRGIEGADVGARAAWAISCGSNALRLAVADTGVDPNHPDLAGATPGAAPRLVAARNVSLGPASAWADSNGHGTAVAGVMAALTHDGAHFDSLGVAGLCGGDGQGNRGCELVPIKISPGATSGSSSFEIARAIVHATDAGARAMNLSFAGGGGSRVERMALYYAITRGCVVVASSGNRGHLGPGVLYPAAFAAHGLCVSVGASDARDRRAAFSSYGPALDLVAPGLDVWTTAPTYPNAYGARWPGYMAASGTSFAAPFVTGAIGLMAAARPELADADFQQILRATARDLGAAGRDDESGWGRLDAAAAVRAAAGEPGEPMALLHDERAALVRPAGRLAPLSIAADSFGTFDRAAWWQGRMAELYEATVTLALPDSFADDARVWPRVGGTLCLRGDFRLAYWAPWAEVAAREGRSVTLRGYLYRVPEAAAAGLESEPDSADAWLPLPPDQARIGFTVFGRRREAPASAASAPGSSGAPLAVSPQPARHFARVRTSAGAAIEVLDLSGRRVRLDRAEPAEAAWTWDLRDDAGRRVRPGLYFVRALAPVHAPARVIVLD